jgi:Ca2+-binding EF-hand superfamily protein
MQDRNIRFAFNALDTAGSGAITSDDFYAYGRRICDRFGVDVAGEPGQKIMDCYTAWWEQLRTLDADGDGRVTLEEFAKPYKNGDQREFFDQPLARLARVVAEVIDTDDDGFVTEQEYLNLLTLSVSDRQAALAGFQQLDTDGDGRVSVAEFEAGIAAVLLSNDPSTPGTAMLGQA